MPIKYQGPHARFFPCVLNKRYMWQQQCCTAGWGWKQW